MDVTKYMELIVHPARLQIIQTLARRPMSTTEIADELPDVPKSSVYRHLKLLLDGEVVEVVDTRVVNGIEEKYYGLASRSKFSSQEMEKVSKEDHLRFFTTYITTLMHSFANSLDRFGFDINRMGYSEVTFYATDEEFEKLARTINEAVVALMKNEPGEGRRRQKLATILYPLVEARHDD